MQLYIGIINGDFAKVEGEEFVHFAKVLRGKIGQEIWVTDGQGTLVKGKVSMIQSKSMEVEVQETFSEFEKRNYYLHIAIAPTKNIDRIEFFLEKATEIGIDEITFLQTFHSERKNINIERCQKIVNAAVKQSLKTYVPKVNPMVKFQEFISKQHSEEVLFAHCNEKFERMDYKSIIQPKSNYLILIGPEGDFAEPEIQMAYEKNYKGVSLGYQRFRTETAALNAVFGINFINNRIF